MGVTIWAIGEPTDGGATRLSTEVATLARRLAEASGGAAVGVVVAADPDAAAAELAGYVPRVLAIPTPLAAERPLAAAAAPRLAALAERDKPACILVGATPDGRDIAGALSALTETGVLANATGVDWDAAAGPTVHMGILGGRFLTTSVFSDGRGIVLVRPNAVSAEMATSTGTVEVVDVPVASELPAVAVRGHVSTDAAAVPIEEARVVVSGGRGVGGAEGFRVVEELAGLLGGVVGATRAAVDAGWIPYSRQIGQTGKTVKPALYLALGVSGAIQHKVGMQGADAVVAVNRDPDAPLAEFADLFVVGDLFEVGPAIAAEIRSRRG